MWMGYNSMTDEYEMTAAFAECLTTRHEPGIASEWFSDF